MNDESLHPYIEPELEARIVALILGEASDFERDELERRINESPELALFKKRLEAVHNLLHDVAKGDPTEDDSKWKLPEERRNKILATLEEEPPQSPVHAVSLDADKSHPKPNSLRWTEKISIAAAAVLIVGVTAFFMTLYVVSTPRSAPPEIVALAAPSADLAPTPEKRALSLASTSPHSAVPHTSLEAGSFANADAAVSNYTDHFGFDHSSDFGTDTSADDPFAPKTDPALGAAMGESRSKSALQDIRQNIAAYSEPAIAGKPIDQLSDNSVADPFADPAGDGAMGGGGSTGGWARYDAPTARPEAVIAAPQPATTPAREGDQNTNLSYGVASSLEGADTPQVVEFDGFIAMPEDQSETATENRKLLKRQAGQELAKSTPAARDEETAGRRMARFATITAQSGNAAAESDAKDRGRQRGAAKPESELARAAVATQPAAVTAPVPAPNPQPAAPALDIAETKRKKEALTSDSIQSADDGAVPILGDVPTIGTLFSTVTAEKNPAPVAAPTGGETSDNIEKLYELGHDNEKFQQHWSSLSEEQKREFLPNQSRIAGKASSSVVTDMADVLSPELQDVREQVLADITDHEIDITTKFVETESEQRLAEEALAQTDAASVDGIALRDAQVAGTERNLGLQTAPTTALADQMAIVEAAPAMIEEVEAKTEGADAPSFFGRAGAATNTRDGTSPDTSQLAGFAISGGVMLDDADIAPEPAPPVQVDTAGQANLNTLGLTVKGGEVATGTLGPAPAGSNSFGEQLPAQNQYLWASTEGATSGMHRDGKPMDGETYEKARADKLARIREEWEAKVPLEDLEAHLDPDINLGSLRAPQESRINKLEAIIVPRLEFNDTPLEDAVEFLKQKSVELDMMEPDASRKGLDIKVQNLTKSTEDESPESPRITLSLTDVPLSEALRYTSELAGMKYKVDDDGVIIVPRIESAEELFTNTYQIPPSLLGFDPFAQASNERIQDLLEERGIAFPPGASASFDPSTSLLKVRNTKSQTELFELFISLAEENLREDLSLNGADSPALGINEKSAATEPFSTFSLHVSDVSFKLAKAALEKGEWPDANAVRIEEFVNAFDYNDPMPSQEDKVSCQIEQSIHPFLQQRNLIRISMRTAAAGRAGDTPLRLNFLVDNSGSMERIDRRETVRNAFALLTDHLQPTDQATLISFARQPRLIADQVTGDNSQQLIESVNNLPSEGGTNLEAALELAFEKAMEQREDGAQNRIVLFTDGAANLGDAKPENLSAMVETMRNNGIAFDAAGIGADGLNDEILEALTRKGDGRYYLLDRPEDADAGFAKQIAGALRPAAKNVKVQVEFNPNRVGHYKLLGFEKHLLEKEDFRDDSVDAAEMAAEEAGVAVYQVEPLADGEGDLGSVSVRFRDMSSGEMVENRWPIPYEPNPARPDQALPAQRLATTAALFAARLKGTPLGESVSLEELSANVADLPEAFANKARVQQLQQMINQARQLER